MVRSLTAIVIALAVVFGAAGASGQESEKLPPMDLFVYLDKSQTIFPDAAGKSGKTVKPAERLVEMLRQLMTFRIPDEDRPFVSDGAGDRVFVYSFAADLEQLTPQPPGIGTAPAQKAIDAYLKVTPQGTSDFNLLLRHVADNKDLFPEKGDNRLKVVLVASDFLHDTTNASRNQARQGICNIMEDYYKKGAIPEALDHAAARDKLARQRKESPFPTQLVFLTISLGDDDLAGASLPYKTCAKEITGQAYLPNLLAKQMGAEILSFADLESDVPRFVEKFVGTIYAVMVPPSEILSAQALRRGENVELKLKVRQLARRPGNAGTLVLTPTGKQEPVLRFPIAPGRNLVRGETLDLPPIVLDRARFAPLAGASEFDARMEAESGRRSTNATRVRLTEASGLVVLEVTPSQDRPGESVLLKVKARNAGDEPQRIESCSILDRTLDGAQIQRALPQMGPSSIASNADATFSLNVDPQHAAALAAGRLGLSCASSGERSGHAYVSSVKEIPEVRYQFPACQQAVVRVQPENRSEATLSFDLVNRQDISHSLTRLRLGKKGAAPTEPILEMPVSAEIPRQQSKRLEIVAPLSETQLLDLSAGDLQIAYRVERLGEEFSPPCKDVKREFGGQPPLELGAVEPAHGVGPGGPWVAFKAFNRGTLPNSIRTIRLSRDNGQLVDLFKEDELGELRIAVGADVRVQLAMNTPTRTAALASGSLAVITTDQENRLSNTLVIPLSQDHNIVLERSAFGSSAASARDFALSLTLRNLGEQVGRLARLRIERKEDPQTNELLPMPPEDKAVLLPGTTLVHEIPFGGPMRAKFPPSAALCLRVFDTRHIEENGEPACVDLARLEGPTLRISTAGQWRTDGAEQPALPLTVRSDREWADALDGFLVKADSADATEAPRLLAVAEDLVGPEGREFTLSFPKEAQLPYLTRQNLYLCPHRTWDLKDAQGWSICPGGQWFPVPVRDPEPLAVAPVTPSDVDLKADGGTVQLTVENPGRGPNLVQAAVVWPPGAGSLPATIPLAEPVVVPAGERKQISVPLTAEAANLLTRHPRALAGVVDRSPDGRVVDQADRRRAAPLVSQVLKVRIAKASVLDQPEFPDLPAWLMFGDPEIVQEIRAEIELVRNRRTALAAQDLSLWVGDASGAEILGVDRETRVVTIRGSVETIFARWRIRASGTEIQGARIFAELGGGEAAADPTGDLSAQKEVSVLGQVWLIRILVFLSVLGALAYLVMKILLRRSIRPPAVRIHRILDGLLVGRIREPLSGIFSWTDLISGFKSVYTTLPISGVLPFLQEYPMARLSVLLLLSVILAPVAAWAVAYGINGVRAAGRDTVLEGPLENQRILKGFRNWVASFIVILVFAGVWFVLWWWPSADGLLIDVDLR